jgi:hypothetical protein
MSAARDAKRSEGRLRARGKAKAGTGRPSARPEPDALSERLARWAKEGDPKGPTPCDSERPTRGSGGLAVTCNEADR